MHCPVPDVCWMNRSTFKPCLWGNLPRKSHPYRASRPRLSIRAYGFPAPNSSHLEAETLMDLSAALRQDPEKPTYHVMPSSGWINDPNGPFYYNGKYHLFYQHIINGCEWDFGIVWGHAVSSDLVHWEHLPPALMPTPGGLDADGCFSGCCIEDADGMPTIMYTGVRLRSNPDCGPLPPQDCDLNLPFIESQLIAIPEPDYNGSADPMLSNWVKSEDPFLAYPPPDMELVGWRDPFIFEFMGKRGEHKEWGMLMGSGIKGKGGAVMIYRSNQLRSGWRYDGMLCEADTVETGAMWECPLLARLPILPEHGRSAHSLLNGFKSLSLNSFNNISAFHSKGHNAVSPTADRKSLSADTNQQVGFSPPKSVTPRIEGFPAPQNEVQKDGSSNPPPGGGNSSNGNEAADRSKSLLSEEILNPYGDENAENTEHNASMRRRPGSKEAGTSSEQEQMSTSGQGSQQQYTHVLCISPDAPTNPVLFWLGNFDPVETRFILNGALGPLKLDLGDTLYAPNLLEDEEGRHILWGWLQERRKVGSYDYAGCLSLPRVMYISGNRLHQEPAPEVNKLRRGECWRSSDIQIFQEESTPLEGVAGPSLDIIFTLERGTATAAGLLLRSWNAGGEGNTAVLYDWERNVLEAVFEGGAGLDLATQTDLDPDAEAQRRVGGPVSLKPGEPLAMRVLIDHSCLEIYLSSGEVLSTRVYRGQQPADSDAGIDFVAFGGTARVEKAEAWEMGSIWQREYIRSSSSYGSVYEPINSVMPVGSPVAV